MQSSSAFPNGNSLTSKEIVWEISKRMTEGIVEKHVKGILEGIPQIYFQACGLNNFQRSCQGVSPGYS